MTQDLQYRFDNYCYCYLGAFLYEYVSSLNYILKSCCRIRIANIPIVIIEPCPKHLICRSYYLEVHRIALITVIIDTL